MKPENQYDDQAFFDQYAKMARSQHGLEGAGEWETLQSNLPDFKNKKVLDLGCGYGWHCKYAVQQGAKEVIGIDASKKMIEKAEAVNHDSKITYLVDFIDEYSMEPNTYDVILSSLVIHYIEDIESLFKKVSKALSHNGEFIFSVEHPIFTAHGSQDWIYKDGEIEHFPVDHYFVEGERNTHFLGSEIKKYHHTLTSYFAALKNNQFVIENIVEPIPPQHMMDIDGMKDELRRPMMIIFKAKKIN